MAAGIRRVVITEDDGAEGYIAPGYGLYEEPLNVPRSFSAAEPLPPVVEEETCDEAEDFFFGREVSELLRRGWSAADIASHLKTSVSKVERAAPKANEGFASARTGGRVSAHSGVRPLGLDVSPQRYYEDYAAALDRLARTFRRCTETLLASGCEPMIRVSGRRAWRPRSKRR